MKWLGQPRVLLLLTLAVAFCFGLLLAFSLMKIVQVERRMSSAVGEDLIWALYQVQFEEQKLLLLVTGLNSGATDAADARALMLQFDLAASRLHLISQGPMARAVALQDPEGVVRRAAENLKLFDREIRDALQHGSTVTPEATARIRSDISALRLIANRLLIAERQEAASRRDEHRAALVEAIGAVLLIVACGAFLIARLMISLRRASLAEAALRRDRDFSNLLLESSQEGVATFDTEMRCTHWNSAMSGLFPIPGGKIIGLPIPEVFKLKEGNAVLVMLERALTGEPVTMGPHISPTGRHFIEKACFPLRSDGEIVGGMLFIRDVTESYRNTQELAQHRDQLEVLVKERTEDLAKVQARLHSAIQTVPDGFAAFDDDDRLVIANPRAGELLPEHRDLFTDGTRLEAVLESLGMAYPASGTQMSNGMQTHEFRSPGGAWILVMLGRSEDGGSVMRLADVTQYKETALTLEKALKRERDLRDLYRSFVSMVSHQFRTPLSIVDSGAQRMIRRGAEMTGDEIRERAGKIRAAAMRLTRLVSSTLNAAKLEAGQIDLNVRRCDIAKLVEDACERQQEADQEREFRLDIEGLPSSVLCDPLLVDQILSNLLSNAVKYSPAPAPIEIEGKADADWFHLRISDRGVGIPENEQSRLFDRFFRATTAAGIEGTGIGLYVARTIARMHGGEVRAEPRHGGGSSFTLSLPTEGKAA
jgi:PAS domain S-box-containing protein